MNERVAGQQSVARAVEVLFAFTADQPSLRAAEVASRLGLNRTTAWRYLQTLAATGLVRELGEGRFALGSRTVGLAEAYTAQWGDLSAAAGAALVRLRDAVGETSALHLRQGWSRIVVRQVESRHELHRTYRDLGVPLPLLHGAPSLAILAALPLSEQRAYLDGELRPSADRSSLEAELARIRERGWAVSQESRVPGVASVAAALTDRSRTVLGSVNITGPQERVALMDLDEVGREVVAAAGWIEANVLGVADLPT
ncbi:IclR family transcriptional regulator [Ornithinimicrobium tianjinense]|uniref:IclR family transcriptional regulator n=1 Tax=Ornithinimicrobium tianjinense TaxID=1195761 RepID=A0A917F349_9MICO|nr:IclR family transcriptional regulator [Ornithinimicrobium tianjinense]GGF40256.1 IclR family transcriptional regulator [Ornithinimicrobium tianjinense]